MHQDTNDIPSADVPLARVLIEEEMLLVVPLELREGAGLQQVLQLHQL